MDDDELVALVRSLRVRVDLVGDTVSGPASVRNATVGLVNPVEIQKCFHCCQQINRRESFHLV